MKWKLTVRYLLSILIIVFAVTIVNIVALFGMLYLQQQENYPLNVETGETFTREFTTFLSDENGEPTISQTGIDALETFGAWVQILDENGVVVNEALTKEDSPAHYRPIDLVHNYKYMDDDLTVHYIGEFNEYSYLIGVPHSEEERFIFTTNVQTLFSSGIKLIAQLTIVDFLIAVAIGLLFSMIIMKPVSAIIHRISLLRERDFSVKKMERQGIFKRVFANLDDVSETLQAHEEERLKLEKMREEWINNISHDLKTPLASIQGFSELLQSSDLTEEERVNYSQVIERKAIYMGELMEDFQLTTRLREKSLLLNCRDVNAQSFVKEIVIELLNDPAYEGKSIHFESEKTYVSWSIDEHLMKRAILNLIHNALAHNREDVHVTVRLNDKEIMIEDNGRGIPQEDVEHIFDRYYRGTSTEATHGTGLGLAIAKDIIEAHGWTLHLASEVGKGTRVTIGFNKTS